MAPTRSTHAAQPYPAPRDGAGTVAGETARQTVRRLWEKRRAAARVLPVLCELAGAVLAPPVTGTMRAAVPGHAPMASTTTRLVLYAHFARDGRLHPMVLRQLQDYAAAGFAVVFITASPDLPPQDIEAARAIASLVITRRNFGLDFGSWKDAWATATSRFPAATEVLLANDSILGPIRPLGPVLDRMRACGDGLIGLTESRWGPPHLQSYLLLAKGRAAVADLGLFLTRLRLTHSKWLMVRRGEYALSQFMARRGHTLHALYAYEPVRQAALAAHRIDGKRNFNPTHHAWDILIDEFGYPFIKRELLVANPNRISGLDAWPLHVPADSPIKPAMLHSFLRGNNTGCLGTATR